MKPLVAYYGGKQRMVNKIMPHITTIKHTVYVEPFCGGAAILFAKPVPNRPQAFYREVINDTSDLLINMYRVAIEQPNAFDLKIRATLYSRSEYNRANTMLKNPSDYDKLDLAWAYWIGVTMAFANKLFAGWGTAVVSQSQAHVFDRKKTAFSIK